MSPADLVIARYMLAATAPLWKLGKLGRRKSLLFDTIALPIVKRGAVQIVVSFSNAITLNG
jgi:hypothetical protein